MMRPILFSVLLLLGPVEVAKPADLPKPVEKDAPATLFPLEPVADPPNAAAAPVSSRLALQTALEEVRRELLEIQALLDKLLAS